MTLCFARRFATYNRAPLIFQDLKRAAARHGTSMEKAALAAMAAAQSSRKGKGQ